MSDTSIDYSFEENSLVIEISVEREGEFYPHIDKIRISREEMLTFLGLNDKS